jgi:cation:H+ antiporter
MEYILLLLGFGLLVVSGNFLVDNAVLLAKKLRIKPIIVAVCIISIGTSAPEIFVSVLASVRSIPSMSLGNIVGSNIANIALCLGLASFFAPIKPQRSDVKMDWFILITVSVLLILFSMNKVIVFWEGLVFVTALILFFYAHIHTSRKSENREELVIIRKSMWLISVMILASFYGLYYGAKLLVDNAEIIAYSFGVSEKVIGVTILAFGTSAPELATVIIAGIKKQNDISIGTILGSNIVNIVFAIGLSSLIADLDISSSPSFTLDFIFMMMLTLFVALPIFNRKFSINYIVGIVFIIIYIVYVNISYI